MDFDEKLKAAEKALQGGDFTEAEQLATEVVRLKLDHPIALRIRGEALLAQGQAKRAAIALSQLAQVQKYAAAESFVKAARASWQANRADEASSYHRQAISLLEQGRTFGDEDRLNAYRRELKEIESAVE